MNIYDVIVILGSLLHGFAKGATDLRLFHCRENYFYRWANNNKKDLRYYFGGSWNQGYFWTADFWHYWEHIKGLSLVLIAVAAMQTSLHPLWFFLLYWLEGRMFVFVYHYWLTDIKRGNFWHFLKNSFI